MSSTADAKRVLEVYTKKIKTRDDKILYRTYWKIGNHCKHALDIELLHNSEHQQTIAEIIAIRYLLDEKQVLGHLTCSENVRVIGSSDHLKNYLSKDFNFNDIPHEVKRVIYPFTTRYHGLEINICIKPIWLNYRVKRMVSVEQINDSYCNYHEIFDIPVIGKVIITKHAIEQCIARNKNTDITSISKGWRFIIRQLMSGRLVRYREFTEKNRDKSIIVELWNIPGTVIYYFLRYDSTIKEGEQPVKILVTCYTDRNGMYQKMTKVNTSVQF